jgi:hypothetical protein
MHATRRAERLVAIRLRIAINIHLDDRGVTQPAEVGAAVGLPTTEAVRLLNRRQYREGDIEALRRVADHLGLAPLPVNRPARPADAGADSMLVDMPGHGNH